MKKNNIPISYLIIFLIIWGILAINPYDRYMWFIENTILAIFLIILIVSYKWFKLSNLSYTLIFIFAILQSIGAHYTYALVPMDYFTNFFGFERNHFDRIVHFSFGFLLAYPFRELLLKTSELKTKFWTYYFPVEMAFGTGAFYEIVEWLFAVSSDPEAGSAFLGSQGDIWDAQTDMFLAGLGATISMFITFVFILIARKTHKK